MGTIIKTASVKVMRSYDYCHFEINMGLENENGLTKEEIDNTRKECQRLADKAVVQYRKAKEMAANRENAGYRKRSFEEDCKRIRQKSEGDRTVNEVATLKQYEDESWSKQFDYDYDYEDSPEDLPF